MDRSPIRLKQRRRPSDHRRDNALPRRPEESHVVMDAPRSTTPDRKSVIAARKDIETSSVEAKDELLTELLCRTYPLRVSQDS
jgi:hypothetical protein